MGEVEREPRASDVQRRKFEAWRRHPQSEAAIETVQHYIASMSTVLLREAVGVSWGVTVQPNRLARINVGRAEAFSVDRDGRAHVYLQGAVDDFAPGTFSAADSGFDRFEPNFIAVVPLDEVETLLGDDAVRGAALAQVERYLADRRTLMRPNWHNPLTEGLLWR